RDLHAAAAAERAEHDAETAADGFEAGGGVGVAGIAARTSDETVPLLANALLGFEHHRAPYPNVISATRVSACLTSSSSVSGSMIAARMARSSGMPSTIRLAQ